MQKVLSSLLVLSGLFIAFSGTMAHADGGSMRDMYEKMGFSWGGGSGSGSGSHGQYGPGSSTPYGHSCAKSGSTTSSLTIQPPSWQQHDGSQTFSGPGHVDQGSIRGALELPPPDDSSPPAPTTTPGV